MFRDHHSFENTDTPCPRLEVGSFSGGDSWVKCINHERAEAGVIFRSSRHGTSPQTSAGLTYLRNGEERCPDVVDGEESEKTVWRAASEGGLLACRKIHAGLIVTALQADDYFPECIHIFVTDDILSSVPEVSDRVIVGTEDLRRFLDLPVLMRQDWKRTNFQLSYNMSPHDALRADPQKFGFQRGVTKEVETILENLAIHHPESFLYS